MNIDIRRRSVQWSILLGAWAVYGVIMTGQTYIGYARAGKLISLWYAGLLVVPYVVLWICLTPVVVMLARKYPLGRTVWSRNVGIHLGCSVVIAVSQNFIANVFVEMFIVTESPFKWDWIIRSLITLFDYGMLVYWVILLVHEAFESLRRMREEELRASRLETQLVDARLQALKTQLQPHFLFNTLHSISELIHEDIEAADTMIARLGDFLRLTLDNSGTQMVTLANELESLRCYIEIEQTRFRGRLELKLEIDEDALDAQVPCFLWQPMVENAIRHGLATSHAGGRITFRARHRSGVLQLQVEDNGAGLLVDEQDEPRFREGVGLASTRAILQHLYGPAHSFTLRNADTGGVIATLEIPFTALDD